MELLKIIVIIFLFIIFRIICTSDNDFEKAKKQLQAQGYTNIENTGYDLFCCSDEDNFSTGFKAKDKNGNIVEGCICSGILKGLTIRFK